jgi:hypothetical protein
MRWFDERQSGREACPLLRVAMRLPIFWTESDVNHDKGRSQAGRGRNNDGVACCEWGEQRIRQNKNKSPDCHFKIAVLPQQPRDRIASCKWRRLPGKPCSSGRSSRKEGKAAISSSIRFSKPKSAEKTIAFLEGEYKRVGRAIAELSKDLEKLSKDLEKLRGSIQLREQVLIHGEDR